MSGSVNKVILVGNLGQDPEIKSLNNGNNIANLSIATGESWRDKQTGERREKTEWHRVVIFNEALVGIAEKYLRKGDKIYLEGQLQTRSWEDQQGQKRYSTEVILQSFNSKLEMLSSKNSGGNQHQQSYDQSRDGMSSNDYNNGKNGTRPLSEHPGNTPDDMDDEIPF